MESDMERNIGRLRISAARFSKFIGFTYYRTQSEETNKIRESEELGKN
jgi:hypothetical protein